jgi:non-ribosomal peptide synthetase component E (peptide arylation enzyme)
MKRMNEVFELPTRAALVHVVMGAQKQGVLPITADEHAAHAINHVDALADALELMIDNNWKSAHERQCAQLVAKSALSAYRGEK